MIHTLISIENLTLNYSYCQRAYYAWLFFKKFEIFWIFSRDWVSLMPLKFNRDYDSRWHASFYRLHSCDNPVGYNKQEWTTNWILYHTSTRNQLRFVWFLLLMLIKWEKKKDKENEKKKCNFCFPIHDNSNMNNEKNCLSYIIWEKMRDREMYIRSTRNRDFKILYCASVVNNIGIVFLWNLFLYRVKYIR